MRGNRRANANYSRSAITSLRARQAAHAAAALDQARRRDRAAFRARNVPLTRDGGKARLEAVYAPARKNKALALGPGGALFFPIALDSVEEAVRRALESCGGIAGVPCMIVALNDNFVVPIPASLKITGFFKAAGNTMISADARDDVARRLADASSGWNAVAVGAAAVPGWG
jgi:adenylate cyclase